MSIPSKLFLDNAQECNDHDERQAIHDAVREQSRGLIKGIGGYVVPEIEKAPFTRPDSN